MAVNSELFESVRHRAHFACEYCGVTEQDTRGLLTIDHYQPVSRSGSDDLSNLIYACFRCNLYKADFWPAGGDQVPLWNPRLDAAVDHFAELEDGRLLALTEVGRITLRRLRLNRPALVSARASKRRARARVVLIRRLAEVSTTLLQTQIARADLTKEEHDLLEEQRRILEALRSLDE